MPNEQELGVTIQTNFNDDDNEDWIVDVGSDVMSGDNSEMK